MKMLDWMNRKKVAKMAENRMEFGLLKHTINRLDVPDDAKVRIINTGTPRGLGIVLKDTGEAEGSIENYMMFQDGKIYDNACFSIGSFWYSKESNTLWIHPAMVEFDDPVWKPNHNEQETDE